MLIFSGTYVVKSIEESYFKNVPRAELVSKNNSTIFLDYYSFLLKLKENDDVKVEIFDKEKPEINKNIYLERGIVYNIAEGLFQASFGGLMMEYKGVLNKDLKNESEIFLSAQII